MADLRKPHTSICARREPEGFDIPFRIIASEQPGTPPGCRRLTMLRRFDGVLRARVVRAADRSGSHPYSLMQHVGAELLTQMLRIYARYVQDRHVLRRRAGITRTAARQSLDSRPLEGV